MSAPAVTKGGDDLRRQQPVTIEWQSQGRAELLISGQLWSEVEWSEKRQAWCIQDAEGRCLRHVASIHATTPDKEAATAIAEAMIRDGRMPSPEAARQAREERLKRERERPSEIARRQAREKENQLRGEYFKLEFGTKAEPPYWELLADVFDLADPELWKRNSFARLRDRLILSLRGEIAKIEYDEFAERRRRGKKRFERIRSDAHYAKKLARLARAKELLALLCPDDADGNDDAQEAAS